MQIDNQKLLNVAARALLRAHVSKAVSQGWRYSANVAIDTICKTYATCPRESAAALQELMTSQRLAQFPHDDLFDLAHAIKFLGAEGDEIVLRLFETAFEAEPPPGQWEQFGTAILPMSIQTSDQWNSIHYSLAEYYAQRRGDNATLMTEIACLAWNAVVRRRGERRRGELETLARVKFRDVECELPQDYSHIWGRDFAYEENRILSHFEILLRGWAGDNDVARIEAALDAVARRNRTSLVWALLMEIGAEHPQSLGYRLEPLLTEPVCLYHPDYAYAAAALLRALHRVGDQTKRERLEQLVFPLPINIRARRSDSWEDGKPAPWVIHSQNRLLAGLQQENIVLSETRDLWVARNTAGELQGAATRHRTEITSHTYTDEELIERRGVNLNDPTNAEMFRLREALKPFAETAASFSLGDIEREWSVIAESEKVAAQYHRSFPEMSQELWGYLVGACAKIARHADWPQSDERWQTIRRILLNASHDAVPAPDQPDSKHDSCSAWGWPSPRIDAATGLPRLLANLGGADEEVAAAIRALSRDGSAAVRFNLASVLPVLAKSAPDSMWELTDAFVADEPHFTVLDAVAHSMDWLWNLDADKVAQRLHEIESRVREQAPADHSIHETLAHNFVFQFLRTGRPDCEKYVTDLIAGCGEPRATKRILPQLHVCRAGGWMTAGDPEKTDEKIDALRARTWTFLLDLLSTAHSRLQSTRRRWLELKQMGNNDDSPEVKQTQATIEQLAHIVDGIASELYFGSGAFADKQKKNEEQLTPAQTERFWREAAPLLKILAKEPHPHTAYEVVQTLHYLLPCSPEEVFLLAAESIRTSSTAGFQFESLAVPEVVKIVQRVLADHRDILQVQNGSEPPALTALLEVLDIFVEAGWPEARALTHRLEEIYR
ncbi:MAG TPA: hypothetical protein VGM66_08775 [Candidatus Udaeobacter sp.]